MGRRGGRRKLIPRLRCETSSYTYVPAIVAATMRPHAMNTLRRLRTAPHHDGCRLAGKEAERTTTTPALMRGRE
jgi:hypothetical protein